MRLFCVTPPPPSFGPPHSTRRHQFANEAGVGERFHTLALGDGQGSQATERVISASRSGAWVYLANCHLMTDWLPNLEKIL